MNNPVNIFQQFLSMGPNPQMIQQALFQQNPQMQVIYNQMQQSGLSPVQFVMQYARQNNIPMKLEHGISFVSGFSPSIFQQIMSGKTAMDLMYEVLNQKRYEVIC